MTYPELKDILDRWRSTDWTSHAEALEVLDTILEKHFLDKAAQHSKAYYINIYPTYTARLLHLTVDSARQACDDNPAVQTIQLHYISTCTPEQQLLFEEQPIPIEGDNA